MANSACLFEAAKAVVGVLLIVADVARTGMLTRPLASEATGANAFIRMGLFRVWHISWPARRGRATVGFRRCSSSHSRSSAWSAPYAQFYFLLSAGCPCLVAILLFLAAVVPAARGILPLSATASLCRLFVLGVAVLYSAVSEFEIEFVCLPFCVNILLVLLGILAAVRWLGARAFSEGDGA